MSVRKQTAFTLIELLVVVAIITLLMSLVLPGLKAARRAAKGVVCLSNQRQIGLAARMYMDNNRGEMFHHHEGWVLDDGTQVDTLPATLGAVEGGGVGHSAAEKPWAIFFQPYLGSRKVGFCPSDPTPRSRELARSLEAFNGGITLTTQAPPDESELALAERDGLNLQSYLLNSVFSHKSARFAVEGVLDGFLNDTRSLGIANRNIIMFSERNSEAMNAPDNDAYGSVSQDDYDAWVGESALVRWGPEAGPYANEGWIRYNRHGSAANYVFIDGHAERRTWREARMDQFPDRIVRQPLDEPPN